ncbi:MAG: cell division protein ZipA, partial [Halomonas sp.]
MALVTLIVVDGVRRLQRQRRVPRLDEVKEETRSTDPDEQAREAEINWELPSGGARVLKPADFSRVQPKPKLERQECPAPSRVQAALRRQAEMARSAVAESAASTPSESIQADSDRSDAVEAGPVESKPVQSKPIRTESVQEVHERREPRLSALDEASSRAIAAYEPLVADPDEHDNHAHDDERYRLVDLEGMGDSFKNGSRRMGASVQRFGASLQKTLAERREHKRLDKACREKEKTDKTAPDAERRRRENLSVAEPEGSDPLFASSRTQPCDHSTEPADAAPDASYSNDAYEIEFGLDHELEPGLNSGKVRVHPVLEKALRLDVSAEHARKTLGAASELIVISV